MQFHFSVSEGLAMDCLQQKGVISFPWHLTAVTIVSTVLRTPVASCTNTYLVVSYSQNCDFHLTTFDFWEFYPPTQYL